MPGPGGRGTPAVPNTMGPSAVRGFTVRRPLGQTSVDPVSLVTDVGGLIVAGFAPGVTASANQSVTPGIGVVDLTGFAPVVAAPNNQSVTAGVGAISVTGFAPSVVATANQSAAPGVGVLAVTGFSPTVGVSANQSVLPGVGALTVSGFAPVVALPVAILPGVGVLTLAGFAPSVALPVSVVPSVGTVSLAGFAPTVTASSAQNVTPGVGDLALTGFAPSVAAGTGASPDTGVLTLVGFAPTVSATQAVSLTPDVGLVSLDGFAPTVQGDVVAVLAGGGFMQPIRRAKQAPVVITTYEEYPPTVTVARVVTRFIAIREAKPVSLTTGTGVVVCDGYAPTVDVSVHAAPSPSLGVAAPGRGGSVPAPRAADPSPQAQTGSAVGPLAVEDTAPQDARPDDVPALAEALEPAWLATPVWVAPETGWLAVDGYAPTIVAGSTWSPDEAPEDDDTEALFAALALMGEL